MLVKGPLYILGEGCKERIHSIRNDQSDQFSLLGFKASGISIYFISQFLEQPDGEPVTVEDGAIRFTVRPYEIKTLRIR